MIRTEHILIDDLGGTDRAIFEVQQVVATEAEWKDWPRSKDESWSPCRVKIGRRWFIVAVNVLLTGPMPHPATIGFWSEPKADRVSKIKA